MLRQSERAPFLLWSVRAEREKNIVVFPDWTQSFAFTKSGEGRAPHKGPPTNPHTCSGFWVKLKLSTGDFVRRSHATIIRQLMATERRVSCPPQMESSRLCFNCLQLPTCSLPFNCHHAVRTTATVFIH